MKILSEGDPNLSLRPIVFLCLNCGCKFEATKHEYKVEQREGPYCQCPCCGDWISYAANLKNAPPWP